MIIVDAGSGLVAKATSSPIPASRRRSRSSVHPFGRYSSRSNNVRPALVAYARDTPIYQFSIRPAVPEYCRATPADLVPFFKKPVSSTTSTPASPPKCSTT